MRIKLCITPKETFSSGAISHYHLVGLVWRILRNAGLSFFHRRAKYRPFTFSEIFPYGDFHVGEEKYLILSSPYCEIISLIAESLKEPKTMRLGVYKVSVKFEKVFDLPVRKVWFTGSPVVLREKNGRYWRIKDSSLNTFLSRLEENVKNKLKYFLDIDMKPPFFSGATFLKEVALSFKRRMREILILGSKWYLHLPENWKEYQKLYKFVMDIGIGEKNGMGFGFINPVKCYVKST